jgi:SOS response regulatory protein OraA/RecX
MSEEMTGPGRTAYLEGLTALARRELSETQVRRLLVRRGHGRHPIDEAVARLKDERAIDDGRVAEAIARRETGPKRHGKVRARREIEQAGIAGAVARRALDAVSGDVNEDEVMMVALERRLGGRDRIADDRELRRLYRYLVGQGFEAERVMNALTARRRAPRES